MPSRRAFLAALGATATAALAGCGVLNGDPPLPVLGCCSTVRAGWPSFGRGPGHRSYLPDAATVGDSPTVAWRTPAVETAGYPVVAEGTLAYRDGGRVRVLDAASGRSRWTDTTNPDASPNTDVSIPDETLVPTLSARPDDRLFVGATDGSRSVLRAYERDGTVAWETPLPEGTVGTAATVLGDEAAVVGTTAGRLFRVDPVSGDVDWQRRVYGPVTREAAMDARTVYVPAAGELYALDRETGRGRWRTDLDAGPLTAPVTTPGGVLVGTRGGTVVALDGTTGAVDWRADASEEGDALPGIAVGRRRVFAAAEGTLVALHPETGSERWRRTPGSITTSGPVVADETVYVGTEDGIRAFATDGSDRRTPWQPDITSGWALVPTPDRLYLTIDPASENAALVALE